MNLLLQIVHQDHVDNLSNPVILKILQNIITSIITRKQDKNKTIYKKTS